MTQDFRIFNIKLSVDSTELDVAQAKLDKLIESIAKVGEFVRGIEKDAEPKPDTDKYGFPKLPRGTSVSYRFLFVPSRTGNSDGHDIVARYLDKKGYGYMNSIDLNLVKCSCPAGRNGRECWAVRTVKDPTQANFRITHEKEPFQEKYTF